MLGDVQKVVPNMNPEDVLKLSFRHEISDEDQLATVCLLSTGLKYIWESRVEKKPIIVYTMRAEIEAKFHLKKNQISELSY